MSVTTLEKKDIYSAISDSLLERHYQELKESAIDDEIIRLNFRSILDGRELDKVLNRNTKRRWKHSDLVPGWMISGIDPLTEEPTLLGCQVKPDSPRIDKSGKKIKYENPSDSATTPLFLRSPNIKWSEVIDDVLIPVIIGEGGKKAASGLSHGFPTIALPGVSTCRKLGRLHQDLLLFCKLGRAFYICFDNDILYKKQVYKALIKLAVDIAYNGGKVFVVEIPPGAAKGMDDYLAKFGKEAFEKLLESALTFEEFKSIAESSLEDEEKEISSKLAINYHLIKQKWGDYLAFNTLSKEVELYGTKLKEEEARLTIALEYDIDMSSTDAQVILSNLARANSYSPVVDYLDEVAQKHKDIDPAFLDDLAFRFFGTKEKIYSTYFKKFLISAVARARQPGCQVDHVFMLQSFKQGTGKSTFFKTLFGSEFFTDQLGAEITSRDEKMKVASAWCLEWAECDHVYRKKDVSAVKNFITSPVDTFRAPYARKEESHPRPSVIVGTTNDLAPLRDPSGNRRFLVTPVSLDKIPRDLVRELRDQIWAAADKLYQSGHEWKLSDEDEILREISNEKFSEIDPWQETIENLLLELGEPDFISTQAIVNQLGFDKPKDVKGFDLVRIQTLLKKLGFEKSNNPKRIAGKLLRGWERINKKYDFSDAETVTCNKIPETPVQQELETCYTPVTPPVTAVTDDVTPLINTENINVTNNQPLHPVTPPVTEDVTVESPIIPTVSDSVTPVTPDSPLEDNFSSKSVSSTGTVQLHEKTFNVGDFVHIPVIESVDQITEVKEEFCRITNQELWHCGQLIVINPSDSADCLRIAIAEKNWEIVYELTHKWCQEFKKAVFTLLSPSEQQALTEMKPKVEPIKSKVKNAIPVLLPGEEYWSEEHGLLAKVFINNDTLCTSSCDVVVKGKKIRVDISYGNLKIAKGSLYQEINPGDKVEILTGPKAGKIGIVSSQEGNQGPVYVKFENVRGTRVKLWGHQFRKVDDV